MAIRNSNIASRTRKSRSWTSNTSLDSSTAPRYVRAPPARPVGVCGKKRLVVFVNGGPISDGRSRIQEVWGCTMSKTDALVSKTDYKLELKQFYAAKVGTPVVVQVAAVTFFIGAGKGGPNTGQ